MTIGRDPVYCSVNRFLDRSRGKPTFRVVLTEEGTVVRDLLSLWEEHCRAGWPDDIGPHEGELMTLDTVVGGCVRHYLSEKALDAHRLEILESCVADLGLLLPDLEDDVRGYFFRLQSIGAMLVKLHT